MSTFRTLDDVGTDRRVLARLDLNAPIEDGEVQDIKRFARHAATVQELADDGHRVALMAHQGRPGRDTFSPLEGHASVLASHLDRDVGYVDDVYGERALAAIRDLDPGEVLLLENVRFLEEELADRTPEEHARSDFVRTLADEFDCYVNDAYSAAHRAHASLVGFPRVMDAYAGRVMESEYGYNTSVRARSFDGDVAMALGGTKATDVIDVMESLDDRIDAFLLGGVTGELFLRAAGHDVGYDVEGTELFDEQWAANRETIETLLARRGDRIHLPVDLAYEDGDERAEDPVETAEKTTPYLDVGSETIEAYRETVTDAAAVFVKGALGVFEDERFGHGTRDVLAAIADSEAFSVVGGGDTARAIDLYGLDETAFDHVSVAGGAYIRALTGEELPAVEELVRSVE